MHFRFYTLDVLFHHSAPTRRDILWLIACFGILAACTYAWSAVRNDFVTWDDRVLILGNPIIASFTPHTIRLAFTSYDPELYIPLTFVSYQLTHLVAGFAPWAYHIGNLLLHTLNGVLVAVFLWMLAKRPKVGIVAGALFLIHPLNTEAVMWASARKDVLSAAFFLAMVITYLRSIRTKSTRAWWVTVAFFLLALLSKVVVVVSPGILLLIDWLEGREDTKTMVIEKWPFYLLSFVFGFIAVLGKVAPTGFALEKGLLAARAIFFYVEKFFIPIGLGPLYPFTEPLALTTPILALSVVVVITITAASVATWKYWGWREVIFAWAFFLLLALPSFTNVIKGADEYLDVYFGSDRYVYLPSIAVFFLVGLAVDWLQRELGAIIRWLTIALIAVFAVISWFQAAIWHDTLALFLRTLATYPNAHAAHTNVGTELYNHGDADGALTEYKKAIAIRPNGIAYYNIGQIYLERGRRIDAIAAYRQAILASQVDPDPYTNLGALMLEDGNVDEAILLLEEARSINNQLPMIYINLGLAYEAKGNIDAALASFRAALMLDPENGDVMETIRALGG